MPTMPREIPLPQRRVNFPHDRDDHRSVLEAYRSGIFGRSIIWLALAIAFVTVLVLALV